MDVGTARIICEENKGSCSISGYINKDGELNLTYNFYGMDKKTVQKIMREYGINKAEKLFRMGDVDWKFDNAIFNEMGKCKITGYKEEFVPSHTSKIPIYDCTEH